MYIELTCIVSAIITGCIIKSVDFLTNNADFFESINTERDVRFISFISSDEYCKCFDFYCADGKSYGGDPQIQKTGKGALDIDFKGIKQKEISSNHLLARGGFSNEIETKLIGHGGLKGGQNGSKIRGKAGIGYGPGYQSGFYKSVTKHIKENTGSAFYDSLDFIYFFATYGFNHNRALVIKNTGGKNIERKWVLEFDLLKPMYWKPESNPEITYTIEDSNLLLYHYTFIVNEEILSGETIILEGMIQAVLMLDLPYYIVNLTVNGKVPYINTCEKLS